MKVSGSCKAEGMAGKINTCVFMIKPLSKCSLRARFVFHITTADILEEKNSPTKYLSCCTCSWHTLKENQGNTGAAPLWEVLPPFPLRIWKLSKIQKKNNIIREKFLSTADHGC